jgi:very-short-patch-repair endonuclease
MITNITKRKLIDELILKGNIQGNLDIADFLKRIWDIDNMPSTDSRYKTATQDIWQHYERNDDWTTEYLYVTYFDLLNSEDSIFIKFIEELVHPIIRTDEDIDSYVELINKYVTKDGYELEAVDELSGYPLYKCIQRIEGVRENVKNLIFAADGPKPEIVLEDSISNNIKIVENEENCLVYDRAIPGTGLLWNDLVVWWVKKRDLTLSDKDSKNDLYKRLFKSLDSEPEKLLFKVYYSYFSNLLSGKLPALIPQVYLHYDPYTIRKLKGIKRLSRQRMDFLLLLSSYQRIVIEVDGVQHYSEKTVIEDKEKNLASPKLYSEMVQADREVRLRGYELYRFGGYELGEKNAEELVINFFTALFQKHRILPIK